MINVTKTFLPPMEDYLRHLEQVWLSFQVTNRGSLVQELEERLLEKLEMENIICMCNGTIPIQIAINNFCCAGDEIITTPFSYVATTSSIVWENCIPIFVDICPDNLTIDESKIAEAISSKTKAILATHVFGNPCNVIEIERIANKYNLHVIYDAAHAFGVKYMERSIFQFGDVSTCSFHATKVFHTGEGGALLTNNYELHNKLFQKHNFGHSNVNNFSIVGINGKMSEINAAMGLSCIPYYDMNYENRKRAVMSYEENLSFNGYRSFKVREGTNWNYSYYPLIFDSEDFLLRVEKELNDSDIFPRRYFFPSLNTLDFLENKSEMPVSESISCRILCLPLSHDINDFNLKRITNIINKCW